MYDYQHKPALQKKASAPSAADRSRAPAAQPARAPAWAVALPIQAKLTINQPGDIYEQEADAVAERVMRIPEPRVQRKCACGGEAGPDGECEACWAKRLGVQRKAVGVSGSDAPPSVHETLSRPGQPLEGGTRGFMESRFGTDFGGVRVHTDAQAAESAKDVRARAYTVGQHVVFGAGQYAPRTSEGQGLLAHELAHVGQQGGVRRALQRQHSPGGPYHPPEGTSTRCTMADSCASLSLKINYLQHTIASHIAWDRNNPDPRYPGGRHAQDIAELTNGLTNCIAIHRTKCTNQPRWIPVPETTPVPVPSRRDAMKEIERFIREVVRTGENAEEAARRFLQAHPELRYILIGAGVLIILATIIEDIATFGAGLLDDPATIGVALALIRMAQAGTR